MLGLFHGKSQLFPWMMTRGAPVQFNHPPLSIRGISFSKVIFLSQRRTWLRTIENRSTTHEIRRLPFTWHGFGWENSWIFIPQNEYLSAQLGLWSIDSKSRSMVSWMEPKRWTSKESKPNTQKALGLQCKAKTSKGRQKNPKNSLSSRHFECSWTLGKASSFQTVLGHSYIIY